jgi:hypothetical protein
MYVVIDVSEEHATGPNSARGSPPHPHPPVSVYKLILEMVPNTPPSRLLHASPVAPPVLNFLVAYFIFIYMFMYHCHRVSAKFQLIIIIIIIIIITNDRKYVKKRVNNSE